MFSPISQMQRIPGFPCCQVKAIHFACDISGWTKYAGLLLIRSSNGTQLCFSVRHQFVIKLVFMDYFFLWFIFLFSFESKFRETLASRLGWGGRFLQEGINIIPWMFHSRKKKLYCSVLQKQFDMSVNLYYFLLHCIAWWHTHSYSWFSLCRKLL